MPSLKLPANINTVRTHIFWLRDFKSLPSSVQESINELKREGWNFYAVDQTRGRCYYAGKEITFPVWVLEPKHRDSGKFIWYICHEMAHAFNFIYDSPQDGHGPKFMNWLKRLCPPEFVHHELGYKPRNAAAAGIGSMLSSEEI